ncbi:hypothetical protein NQ315_001497 [Exocentrus adspersus]|uniref:Uncharacterized protein n=1 Tax=Exocentrus adspersus TaxID=1586481 RepID=A0AAV8W8M3_9CUCU|nr:hypothetical protein NQ315_001497 [Exocentrus adspersus]
MSSAKILVILSLQILAVLGLGNNVLINLPKLDEIQEDLKWTQQKVETLGTLLNLLAEEGNVTLIAWQRIWNTDGTLKEIRTIELTIINPVPAEVSLSVEDVEVYEELPVVLQVMDELSAVTGIQLSGSMQQWDRDGSLVTLLKVTPDSIQIQGVEEDLLLWQQNITVPSTAPIQTLVKTLKEQSWLPVAVLSWNTDGTLNLQSSVIIPELMGSVTEATNATMSMMEAALMGIAKGALLHPDHIPKYVVDYMKQNVPGFIWLAGEDVTASWVNPGVQLTVRYDLVDIGRSPITLDVIGVSI